MSHWFSCKASLKGVGTYGNMHCSLHVHVGCYHSIIENSTVSGMLEVCLNHHVFTNVDVLCLVV